MFFEFFESKSSQNNWRKNLIILLIFFLLNFYFLQILHPIHWVYSNLIFISELFYLTYINDVLLHYLFIYYVKLYYYIDCIFDTAGLCLYSNGIGIGAYSISLSHYDLITPGSDEKFTTIMAFFCVIFLFVALIFNLVGIVYQVLATKQCKCYICDPKTKHIGNILRQMTWTRLENNFIWFWRFSSFRCSLSTLLVRLVLVNIYFTSVLLGHKSVLIQRLLSNLSNPKKMCVEILLFSKNKNRWKGIVAFRDSKKSSWNGLRSKNDRKHQNVK